MLYDLLPPFIFFASLGGVIFILSRVTVRLRRSQLNTSIAVAAHADTGHATRQLQPRRSTLELVKSPLTLWSQAFHEIRHAVGIRTTHVLKGMVHLQQRASAALVRRRVARQHASLTTKAAVISPVPTNIKTRVIPRPVISKQVVAPKFFKKKDQQPDEMTSARQAVEAGDLEKAETILISYIYKHTKDTEAYMLLGEIASTKKQWLEAMEIFEQVVKRHPEKIGVWAYLGHAAFHAGRYAKALQALQRAHEADPNDAIILNELLKIASIMDNRALVSSIKEKLTGRLPKTP